MKSVILAIVFFGSLAQAQVDYIAVGKELSDVKSNLVGAKKLTACLLNGYDEAPSCAAIEEVNLKINAFLGLTFTSMIDCVQNIDGKYENIFVRDVNRLRDSLHRAKDLAKKAQPTDAVHAAIAKVEASLESTIVEIKLTVEKADLQNVYVATCLLGEGPTNPTVKELLCK